MLLEFTRRGMLCLMLGLSPATVTCADGREQTADVFQVVHRVPFPVDADLVEEAETLRKTIEDDEARLRELRADKENRGAEKETIRQLSQDGVRNRRELKRIEAELRTPPVLLFCYNTIHKEELVITCRDAMARKADRVSIGDFLQVRRDSRDQTCVKSFTRCEEPAMWPFIRPMQEFQWSRVYTVPIVTARYAPDQIGNPPGTYALSFQVECVPPPGREHFVAGAPSHGEGLTCDVCLADPFGAPRVQILDDVPVTAGGTASYRYAGRHTPDVEYVVRDVRGRAYFQVDWSQFDRDPGESAPP
jgi:hypothetical protein